MLTKDGSEQVLQGKAAGYIYEGLNRQKACGFCPKCILGSFISFDYNQHLVGCISNTNFLYLKFSEK